MKKVFAFLAVLFLAAVCFGQVYEDDSTASTPVISGFIKHDTIPTTIIPINKYWPINNIKNGDRLVVVITLFKQLLNHRNSKWYSLNDMCKGTDDSTYRCIYAHTSIAARKPITGAQWTSYFVKVYC